VVEITHADEERLSRKLQTLLEQNKGESLFSILYSKSNLKDEYVSLDKLANDRLEYHIDRALNI
jgi:hypothetical protein